MSNEEAIAKIKRKACFGGYNNKNLCQWADEGFGKCEECENYMAIAALKAEPCEDAVSREAVLSALSELPHEYKTKEQRARTGGIAACQVIVRELPLVTPKQRWIPVSERLPEKRGMYIVTEKVFSLDDREHTGRFNRMTEQVEFCNGKWQRARFYEVVAWMPLPKPYKEGESE